MKKKVLALAFSILSLAIVSCGGAENSNFVSISEENSSEQIMSSEEISSYSSEETISSSSSEEIIEEKKIYQDKLIEKEYILHDNARFIIDGMTALPSEEIHESYSYIEVNVLEKDRYVISFATQAKDIFGISFIDDYGYCLEQFYPGTDKYQEFNSYQITIPAFVNKMYVNSRDPKQIEIKELISEEVSIEETNQLPTTLKFGSVNCGKFSYSDNVTSKNEYLNEWERMLDNNPYDIFAFEDVSDYITTNETAESVLNKHGNYFSCIEGSSNNLRVSSLVEPETITIVPFQNYIDGSAKITQRYYAIRLTFHIDKRHIAIYGLHLVAEGHISADKINGGYSLSQRLRQIQFSQLIRDGSYYDMAIFAGDFNSQEPGEYDIFVDNGYNLSNCGKFGNFDTLRDIPVDNIIVSSNISINRFAVLDSYNLNTDHTPIFSELIIR